MDIGGFGSTDSTVNAVMMGCTVYECVCGNTKIKVGMLTVS